MNSLRIYLLLLSAALGACTPYGTREGYEPGGKSDPYGLQPYRKSSGMLPRSAEEISGPAVLSLLNQARGELASGRPEQAEATLERAQRIEPRNPFIWQQLATMHLAQSRLQEAENMAQRSNSLARGNPYIEIENWRTIAAARRARGDTAGVEEAQARMAQMQEAIDD
ncbi:MAG: tetratricopeptide repeat protein [Hydrocarboniphaga effusa]|nr:tetratricopeptide repeat protein [Hydrocarboniphaga effusa]